MNLRKIALSAAAAGMLAAPFLAAAQGMASTTPPTGEPHGRPKATMDLSCVQQAIDTRESAIDAAFTAFSTAETSALSTRATALHAAWGITTAKDRAAARNKAWSDFRTANKEAFMTLRGAKKAAWSAFATASKACHAPVVESSGGEGYGSLGL